MSPGTRAVTRTLCTCEQDPLLCPGQPSRVLCGHGTRRLFSKCVSSGTSCWRPRLCLSANSRLPWRKGTLRVRDFSEKTASSWKNPCLTNTSFLVLSPFYRWGNETQLPSPRSRGHTHLVSLNEDCSEERILFWIKIGTILVAAIFKEGIYLLTRMQCFAKKRSLLCSFVRRRHIFSK